MDAPQVVIDLSRLTFLDSVGLGVLVRAWQSAVEVGRPTMVMRPGNPRVMRTLAMAGLDTVLPIEGHDSAANQTTLTSNGTVSSHRMAPA
jgi:anti-anti-sigma factor